MNRIFVTLLAILTFSATVFGQEPKLETDLALKYIAFTPKKVVHAPVIILLHGYGSDEKDLYGLRSVFPPNYIVVSARAPYPLAGGGYQWYESTLINGQKDGKKEELDNSKALLTKFVTQIVNKYNANARNVYVMGFSQGAIMSYAVGLSAPDKVKGIGVLSGMLYPSVRETIVMSPQLKKLKIFIAHGTADERITFAYGRAAKDHLVSIGLKPEFHQYEAMGHSISNTVMSDLMAWLK